MQISSLMCPRCRHGLFLGQTHATTMWGCGYCGGVWLDNHTAQRVIQSACQASLALAKSASDSARGQVSPAPHGMACPVCHAYMRTERVQQAWVDIDRCDAHGTWYDRGELERVARTAHIQPTDWRYAPPPEAVPAPAACYSASADDGGIDSEVAAEIAAEGSFLLLDILLGLLD